MADPVAQYLERYAEPEQALASQLDGPWNGCVVVPAYREQVALLDGLAPAIRNRGDLIILVVNRQDTDVDAEASNAELLASVRTQGESVELGASAELIRAEIADIVLIDRSSRGNALGRRGGVGLARRIGLDLALGLWAQGKLASEWLHTTDADATLPATYFDADAPAEAVALTYPYAHRLDDADTVGAEALTLYELSLRYYLLGLRWAQSPYAFSAIGSTIAVRAVAYAKARGIPKRQAGEDFYLLAKLAKLGAIVRPDADPIELRGVREPRTPFGTAVAVEQIRHRSSFQLYSPASFAFVRRWMKVLDATAESSSLEVARRFIESEPMGAALEDLRVLDHLGSACKSGARRQARVHAVFDAKLTLRLIHNLRDAGLVDVDWRMAVANAPFTPDAHGSAQTVLARFRAAENDGHRLTGVDFRTDQN